MSADARFFDALTAEASCDAGLCNVYGYKLRPFSLWHSVVLQSLKSPCYCGGEIEPAHLVVAASICSFERRVAIPEDDSTIAAIQAFDFLDQYKRWQSYLTLCHASPRTKTIGGDGEGDSLKAPIELLIATYLMKSLGIPEQRAWAMPAGLAFWYFEAHREQESGRSTLITDEEASEMEAALTEQGEVEQKKKNERMIVLLRRRETRMKRCKTDAAKRNVERWFVNELKTFEQGCN